MKKYIKIYSLLLKLNFSKLLTYRINIVNNIIVSLGWGIISIVSMYILTQKIHSAYGWSRNELLLLTGVYGIVVGIFHMFFSRNFERFSQIVHMGQLDSILLKPIDSQFLLSFWLFNYVTIGRIFLTAAFTFYLIGQMHIQISVINMFFVLFFAFLGLLLLYGIWFVTITTTIWLTSLSNLADFLYQINNLSRYPQEMILGAKNIFLYILLPLTFIVTVPTKFFFGKTSLFDIFWLTFFSIFFLILSRKFLKFALRYYTSASG